MGSSTSAPPSWAPPSTATTITSLRTSATWTWTTNSPATPPGWIGIWDTTILDMTVKLSNVHTHVAVLSSRCHLPYHPHFPPKDDVGGRGLGDTCFCGPTFHCIFSIMHV